MKLTHQLHTQKSCAILKNFNYQMFELTIINVNFVTQEY